MRGTGSLTPGYFGVVLTVLAKDARTEWRSKETLATMLLFGVVMTLVLAFSFSADYKTNRTILAGAIWITLLFTGTLGIGRTFVREKDNGAFSALLLSPAERSAVLLAKMILNLALMAIVMCVVAPLLAVMLNVDLSGQAGIVALQLSMGALGFTVVGTPLAVMAISARFAEVMLPMIVFPLVTPVVIAGVWGTAAVLGTTVENDPWTWLKMALAFDAVYGVGGMFLFEKMVTE